MITKDKVIEIFCMADDFCKFFLCNDGKIYAQNTQKAEISPFFYHVKGGSYNDYHPFS